ncbi:MAG: hydrogenase 3 maturation endopeptidase HyCI [Candidatus Omnitrophica bacterium]|nr:hydrogenase 3 maturation endopeptidase HyCI [Candidatus Omnitrophota bacterium]
MRKGYGKGFGYTTILDYLKPRLKGEVVILGIGNTLRRDDGLGVILAERLKNRTPFKVFDVGISPENYLGKIVREKPNTVIIIDAVDFGAQPGEFRLLDADDIKTSNLFSTHNISISLLINYLQNNLKADIIILTVQPKEISLGEGLSPEVKKTVNKLEDCFIALTSAQYATSKKTR